MIFEQLFDPESSTFTYLLARRVGGEAVLIDPVDVHIQRYMDLMERLQLRLVRAIDTHVHADHVTGLGKLRDETSCVTIMGEQSRAQCVSETVTDGEVLDVDGLRIQALYTPGHTDDSYSFLFDDRVFTGDTLLIGGTGRTDFQNGDARAQYDSITQVLFRLPGDTLVYPAHDYRGNTVSTIEAERSSNPRLQVPDVDAYVELMAGLNLPNPRMMDVAVPANLSCGVSNPSLPIPAILGLRRTSARAADPGHYDIVDVRAPEAFASGTIPGAHNVPLNRLDGALEEWDKERAFLLVCARGQQSLQAAERMLEAGFEDVTNLEGGLEAWSKLGRPLTD